MNQRQTYICGIWHVFGSLITCACTSEKICVRKIRFDDYTYSTMPCGCTVRCRTVPCSTFFYFILLLHFENKNRAALAMIWRLAISSPAVCTFFFLAPPRFFASFFFSASIVLAFLLAVRWSSSEFFYTDITLKMLRQVLGGGLDK